MSKIYLVPCKRCGFIHVDVNGAGSTKTIYQKGITGFLNTIYPVSQKLFEGSANVHDLRYHQGQHEGKTRDESKKLDDDEFLKNMHYCIKNVDVVPNINRFDRFLVKKMPFWFRYQANKYHYAVDKFGGSIYPQKPCTDITRAQKEKEPENYLNDAQIEQINYEGGPLWLLS